MVKRVKELKFIEGTVGNNYKTTLDIDVQKFAKHINLKNKSGIEFV